MTRKVRIVLELSEHNIPAGIYSTDNNLADEAVAWLNGETHVTDYKPIYIKPFIIQQEIFDENGQ